MRRTQIGFVGGAVAALTLAVTTAHAEPFSWSGVYEGFFVCDHLSAGTGGGFGRALTLSIRQTGDRIDVQTGAVVDADVGVSRSFYRGEVMASASGDMVSGYLEVCESSFPYNELVRLFPASTGTVPFRFAADTVFISKAVPGEVGRLVAESCKWSMTRVSDDPPDFEGCP
ncbi:hypothetical protein [Bauldia sp.]|uniref:hypothetical protein n=1 Tax=Bauldia sp. TaxID=2575872 RepID=UPI003BACDD3B